MLKDQGSFQYNLDAAAIYPELGLVKTEKEFMQSARHEFTWMHLGNSTLPFWKLSEWLIKHKGVVKPPRTGHIGGTWEAIAEGGGGEVSFNRSVIELNLGYPLLFDSNIIPDSEGKNGDNLYYPGYILESGEILKLPAYVYNDGKFTETKTGNLYSPFAATKIGGKIIAINHIHKERLQDLPGINYVSKVFYDNWSKMESFLRAVMELSYLSDFPRERGQYLEKALDRWIYPNGEIEDSSLGIEHNKKVIHKNLEYSFEEILVLIKKSLEMAAFPKRMTELIKEIPNGVPHLSKEMLMVSLALLDTDFTNGAFCNGKVNPHFHWGGFQMAGLGRDNGYFSSSVGQMKLLATMIGRGLENHVPKPEGWEFKPLAYTLMPAGIFSLLPHSTIPQEKEAVIELLKLVKNESNDGRPHKNKTIEHVKVVVREWLNQNAGKLSKDYLSRFSKLDHPMKPASENPELFVPEPFYELNIQQLSITTGELKEKVWELNL